AGWILELDRGAGIPYEGNYSGWLEQKQKRLEQEGRADDARVKSLSRELDWVRAAPKARQAKSKARINAYEKLLAEGQQKQVDTARISIPAGPRLGDIVINANAISKVFGDRLLIDDLSFRLPPGGIVGVIGPNGAGKSTVLHSIFGFTNIFSGSIVVDGKDVTALTPSEKLSEAGIAYILQDKSVFPQMTVEENLLMGGFLKDRPAEAKAAAEMVFDKYSRLADRRDKPAGVLSGGERRLLEISRALVMQPEVLLVDEPSIGLEPRFIDMVFEILDDLQKKDGKTIIMVEQNAKKGLSFADIGYVLVSGETAIAGDGDELLENPDVGRLFLGG
ncbi:MAG: ATP-binding cassette domain-containing protein, partial [Candidatus Puniceispirillaceae bacterium]